MRLHGKGLCTLVNTPDPPKPPRTADVETSVPGGARTPIVVKLHEMSRARIQLNLEGESDDISVVAGKHENRPADLILWAPTTVDGPSVRAVIDEHHPLPVLVVLDASMRPVHSLQCLRAGAIQCLIDPSTPVLIAYIRSIVRRLHTSY